MGLSREEMQSVQEDFNIAYLHAFAGVKQKVRPKILELVLSFKYLEIPYQIFGGGFEGTKRLNDLIYNDIDHRDFILKLSFHFYARFGNTEARYTHLVENLASGIGFFKPATDKEAKETVVVAPPEIQDRMPELTDVRALLQSNRWIDPVEELEKLFVNREGDKKTP
jgi:hypothetical protein